MKFLAIVLIIILLTFGLEVVFNKLLGVEKTKIADTPGREVDRRGRKIILVSIIFLLILSNVFNFSFLDTKWWWLGYFIILAGFQIFLEWKYIKNSKQYLTTIILSIICLVMLILAIRYI